MEKNKPGIEFMNTSKPSCEYDVCLSFAGEDRDVVSDVAKHVLELGMTVFYDEYEKASLWGKNLYDHLSNIYRFKATYCIIFVSPRYVEKLWTNHERQSAQARAFRENSEYILPILLDHIDVPGLLDTVGYLSMDNETPATVAQMLKDKLIERNLYYPNGKFSKGPTYFGDHILDVTNNSKGFVEFQGLVSRTNLDEQTSSYIRQIEWCLAKLSDSYDAGVGYWTHGDDSKFSRVYATATVMHFLTQLFPSQTTFFGDAPFDYLAEATASSSIDSRAAIIALLASGRLGEETLVKFLLELKKWQINDPGSNFRGSFLLPQAASTEDKTNDNWIKQPIHKDGANFHACHLSDFLLHVPHKYTKGRALADEILRSTGEYIERTLIHNDGVLTDTMGNRSPITLYGYAIAWRLGVQLPRRWRAIADEIFAELSNSERIFDRMLCVMNGFFLSYCSYDREFREMAARNAELQIDYLIANRHLLSRTSRDVAMFGRAVLYGLATISPLMYQLVSSRLQARAVSTNEGQ